MKKILLPFFFLFGSSFFFFSLAETTEEVIPANCASWFDGCNTCGVEDGKLTGCTKMACENPQKGECREYKTEEVIPANCTSWFDGCNMCGVEDGKLTMCTEMFCENPSKGECREYEDDTKECPEEEELVCGQPPFFCPEGLMCAQVMPDVKTYKNKCFMEKEGAELIHQGACEEKGEVLESEQSSSFFPDVFSDTLFASSIEYIKDRGYVQGFGDGTFQPDHQISRYEFAKIIISARFSPVDISACDVNTELTFPDVPKNEWFSPFVCVAQKNGVVQGYANGNFGGIDTVKTPEALKIILEAYQKDLTAYEEPKGSPWYTKYQKAGKDLGLTKEINDAPDFSLRRSEMAEFIYQIEK